MLPVFLHGFTGAPSSWDGVIERLPAGWEPRCLALPGHADEVPACTSFNATCDHIARMLPLSAHVVGYSLGARIALGCALRAREVGGLTLIGVNPGLESGTARRERQSIDDVWQCLLEEEGIDAFVEAWEKQPIFQTQHRIPSALQEAQRRVRRAHNPYGLAASLRATGLAVMPNLWLELHRLTMPVHLIVGADDAKFIGIAERMLQSIKHAHLTVLPNCGHNPLLEAPAALAQALKSKS